MLLNELRSAICSELDQLGKSRRPAAQEAAMEAIRSPSDAATVKARLAVFEDDYTANAAKQAVQIVNRVVGPFNHAAIMDWQKGAPATAGRYVLCYGTKYRGAWSYQYRVDHMDSTGCWLDGVTDGWEIFGHYGPLLNEPTWGGQ